MRRVYPKPQGRLVLASETGRTRPHFIFSNGRRSVDFETVEKGRQLIVQANHDPDPKKRIDNREAKRLGIQLDLSDLPCAKDLGGLVDEVAAQLVRRGVLA